MKVQITLRSPRAVKENEDKIMGFPDYAGQFEELAKEQNKQFLSDLKCSIENKIVAADRAKLS